MRNPRNYGDAALNLPAKELTSRFPHLTGAFCDDEGVPVICLTCQSPVGRIAIRRFGPRAMPWKATGSLGVTLRAQPSDAITPLSIAFMVGPSSALSARMGRILMRFLEAASHRMVSTSEFGCAPWVSM